ncbi:universal stress protein [Halopelagius longus]|uniref:Universal stress protein n=1 Tax=Halopelagius longus TaxID=1236180 RepID=A0A1H1FL73_9EURY|nr:universal stress protein [Halopelagius longus]RDI70052.1 universal stress protein [Halopelagius longus]SDR01568.1 Nucleotide-binding universal stress protein, UspA family [Halopelagius longus]
MYSNILIPTDGSRGAERGGERGLELAEEHGATVHTLFVLDERTYGTPALSSDELYLEAVERRGARDCAEIAAAASERGLDAEVACTRGCPHEEILSYVTANDIDLVVMGGHGTSPTTRPHAYACTDRVSDSAPVPVMSV